MAGLGLPELLILLAVLVLLFGAKQVPRLARAFGQASKELRAGAGSHEPGAGDRAQDRA